MATGHVSEMLLDYMFPYMLIYTNLATSQVLSSSSLVVTSVDFSIDAKHNSCLIMPQQMSWMRYQNSAFCLNG